MHTVPDRDINTKMGAFGPHPVCSKPRLRSGDHPLPTLIGMP